jgi:hypothetical protein
LKKENAETVDAAAESQVEFERFQIGVGDSQISWRQKQHSSRYITMGEAKKIFVTVLNEYSLSIKISNVSDMVTS